MKEIKTPMPRKYLTWSQLSSLEASEKGYIEMYFEGKALFVNEYMRFGSKLANRLETGLPTNNKELEHIVFWLPKSDKQEFKIEENFGDIPLLGIIDGCSDSLDEIREIKTGVKWTQERADKHGQLYFYAMLVYIRTGKIPKVYLDWVETSKATGVLRMTGRIEEFKVEISTTDLIAFGRRINSVWKRIEELSVEFHSKKFNI